MISKGKLNIPDGWHEVSISQFQEINQLDNDDYKTNSTIAILTNEDDEIINHLTKESRDLVMEKLNWVMKVPDENFYKREITIDSISYYMKDLTELSTGEWIDLTNYFKKPIDNLHKICAALYKPVDKINFKVVSDTFLNKLMIGDIYGTLVFFYRIANKSIQNVPNYLATMIQEQMKNRN